MEKDKKNQKPFYKRRKVWIIVGVIVVLFFVIRAIRAKGAPAQETAKVEKGTVKEELVLSGEIKSVNSANLAFNTPGTLSWVGVKIGDTVKKGQALEKLDTTTINSAYQQSLSAYRLAQATVDQVHDNLKGKDTTENFTEKVTRVTAETSRDSAYESMVQARKALMDATLVAPFNGIVTNVVNEVGGMNISIATPQVQVVDPTTIYFSVNADQTEVSRFKVGDTASVSFDAFENSDAKATVTAISFTPSTLESGTVYPIRLKFEVENSSLVYRIGLTGDAHFVLSQKENVLSVPVKFVKSDKTGKYVLIGNGTEKKYVEVGIEGDDRVEIKTDLSEGTVIYN